MAKRPTKAKRKLTDISFEHTGAHVALVSKKQGGAANGYETLVMKSAKNFSPEIVEKMQQVRVTLELPDFLRKFFGMYCDDALILARMMGYEMPEEENEDVESYQDYIESKLESFEILKAMYEADELSSVVSSLQEEDFLSALKDQELVEKAFETAEGDAGASKDNTEVGASIAADDKPAENGNNANHVIKSKKEEVHMPTKTQEVTVEVIEKSQFEAVQKALDEQKVQLEKALATVAAYESEKKENIRKARLSAVEEILGDKDQAEKLFKAVGLVEEEEAFMEALEVLKAIKASVVDANKDMFIEKGVDADVANPSVKDRTRELIRKNLTKQYVEGNKE